VYLADKIDLPLFIKITSIIRREGEICELRIMERRSRYLSMFTLTFISLNRLFGRRRLSPSLPALIKHTIDDVGIASDIMLLLLLFMTPIIS
jgi:hypothetical protein